MKKGLEYNQKTKVINIIDELNRKLKWTMYERELNQMRNKYIYKDISISEFKSDYNKLCCYKDIVKKNSK